MSTPAKFDVPAWVKLCVIPFLMIVLVVLAWIDTRDYRRESEELEHSYNAHQYSAFQTKIKNDVNFIVGCGQLLMQDGQSRKRKVIPEGRACLVKGLSQSSTSMGATVGAAFAHEVLLVTPDDEELRITALEAIDRGRAELVANKSWLYSPVDRLISAHDHSKLYRLFEGEFSDKSSIRKQAELLDEAEYGVLLPEETEKNKIWLRKAL